MFSRVPDDHHLAVGRPGGQHAAGERNGGDQVGLRGGGCSALDRLDQLVACCLVGSGLLDVVVLDLVKALRTERKRLAIGHHQSGAAARRDVYAVEELLGVGQGRHAVALGKDEGGIGGHGTVRRTVLGGDHTAASQHADHQRTSCHHGSHAGKHLQLHGVSFRL